MGLKPKSRLDKKYEKMQIESSIARVAKPSDKDELLTPLRDKKKKKKKSSRKLGGKRIICKCKGYHNDKDSKMGQRRLKSPRSRGENKIISIGWK
ncbi:hypothetical protein POVCU2_0018920 [Plasmodium ovale curtisi]|uniref:Uncharacterized protein n=1 Tax=Plasmodium ovale curtisi TaxID=864141 RepID=A0A1A8VTU9_PLAOA|nr:hypothetical protein POVCU2_0018920 [Plasmodium ovale curtisi]SBS89926.1 hypothetical protein POVCU1_017240 [Plasmodium ovale curtisi]